MSSDIISENAYILSGAERSDPAWIDVNQAPRAGDVIYQFALTLVVPLLLALIVNLCLWSAGIPAP